MKVSEACIVFKVLWFSLTEIEVRSCLTHSQGLPSVPVSKACCFYHSRSILYVEYSRGKEGSISFMYTSFPRGGGGNCTYQFPISAKPVTTTDTGELIFSARYSCWFFTKCYSWWVSDMLVAAECSFTSAKSVLTFTWKSTSEMGICSSGAAAVSMSMKKTRKHKFRYCSSCQPQAFDEIKEWVKSRMSPSK